MVTLTCPQFASLSEIPIVLSHATYNKYWDSILENGLLSTESGHRALHLMDPEDIRTQGLWRTNMEIIVDVAAHPLHNSGLPCQRCGNGLWLQECDVKPKFILGIRKADQAMPDYAQLSELALDHGTTDETLSLAPGPVDSVTGEPISLPPPGSRSSSSTGLSGGSNRPSAASETDLKTSKGSAKGSGKGGKKSLIPGRYTNGICTGPEPAIPLPRQWVRQLIRKTTATCSVWYTHPPSEPLLSKKAYTGAAQGTVMGPVLEADKYLGRSIAVKVPTPYHLVAPEDRLGIPSEVWINFVSNHYFKTLSPDESRGCSSYEARANEALTRVKEQPSVRSVYFGSSEKPPLWEKTRPVTTADASAPSLQSSSPPGGGAPPP